MQEAYFALLKAIDAYDEENPKCTFKTYLKHSIEWYLCRYRKQDKNKRDTCVLDAPLEIDNPEGTTLGEMTEDERAAFEEAVLRDVDMSKVFDTVKSILNERTGNDNHFNLLFKHCIQNETYADIAKERGCSANNIREQVVKALRILRHPQHKELQAFKENYIDYSVRHISLTEFRQTNNSAVEWAAMKRE